MKLDNKILDNQLKYEKKYKEIIVTYHDNAKKSFTPYQWALFEKGVRRIAKKIDFINK